MEDVITLIPKTGNAIVLVGGTVAQIPAGEYRIERATLTGGAQIKVISGGANTQQAQDDYDDGRDPFAEFMNKYAHLEERNERNEHNNASDCEVVGGYISGDYDYQETTPQQPQAAAPSTIITERLIGNIKSRTGTQTSK